VKTADRKRTRKRDQLQVGLRVYLTMFGYQTSELILLKSVIKIGNFYIYFVKWKQMNGQHFE